MSADVTSIMNQLVTDINDQNFQLNVTTVQALVKKLPLKQDNTDPPNMIVVCPGKPEKYTKMSFGGHYMVEVGVMVVIIAPNLTSATANEDTLLQMRQTIANIISGYGKAQLANLLEATVTYDPPFDASQMDKNAWDYSALEGRFTLFY